jgi:fumarate reductase flavoprotein subunit
MKRNQKWAIPAIMLVLVFLGGGCETGNNPDPNPNPSPEIVGSYDIAIVGVGSSGHAAMMAAIDNVPSGGKVIAIEQNGFAFPMMSAGIGAAESAQQQAARDSGNSLFRWFTKDELFNTLFEYSHYTANGPLLRRIVDESGGNLDWLAERGLLTDLQMGSDQGMHISDQYFQTYHMHNFGWMALQEYFTKKGGELRLNTRVIDLIVDGGKVAGVLAEDISDPEKAKSIQINAKRVILCTGGYGPGTEKFKELLELENLEFYAFGGEGNTGSGIEMAVNTAGAKLWGDHSFMLHNNVARKADGSPGNELAGSPLFFLYNWEAIPCVNAEGHRFMNEKLVSNSALWANASYSQGGTYLIVFSKGILDNLEANGITQNMWYIGAVSNPSDTDGNPAEFTAPTKEVIEQAMSFGLMAGIFEVKSGFPVPKNRFDGSATKAADGNTLKSISAVAEEFAQKGWIYKGATISELAKNAGMSNPAVLAKTIEKYNTAVEIKIDTEFGKQEEYLTHKIEGGPFYAMRLSLSSLGGSSGGIMVDKNLQVLDNNYRTISGLYAAGLNAGGFYGPVSTYYDYEGSAMMFATNSGRIAGEEAAKSLK